MARPCYSSNSGSQSETHQPMGHNHYSRMRIMVVNDGGPLLKRMLEQKSEPNAQSEGRRSLDTIFEQLKEHGKESRI